MIFIVASKSHQSSQTETIREEDLSYSVNPHLRLSKFAEVGRDVEANSLHCTGECNATNEKNCEENVWEEGSEVNNLKCEGKIFMKDSRKVESI
jgi:hypothetical protein